ncbi:MAG: alpha/beta hydrolase [Crocinitomicaceae bacterium]|nr:alpha/beta hydrolase [Crocinitomicaceae bacterium]
MSKKRSLLLFLYFGLVTIVASAQDSTSFDFEKAYSIAIKEYEDFEQKHGHFLQTENVNMHYSTWGDSTDIPIVWLHGTNSNTTEVVDFVDSLTVEGYYVIAVDYYGHGLTPIPRRGVSIYNVADDIIQLLDHLNIDKVVVGGMSRGGIIASAFYDEYPDKVLGLILEDGGSASFLNARQAMDRSEIEKLYTEMYSSNNDTTFATKFEAFKFYYNSRWTDSQYWWFAFLKEDVNGNWALNPGLSKWLGQRGENVGVRNIYQTTQAPLFESSALMLMPEVIYRNLKVPILIFDPQGDDDNGLFALSDQNIRLKEQHPELITLKHYPNSGHALHFEESAQFVEDLLHFLSKVRED